MHKKSWDPTHLGEVSEDVAAVCIVLRHHVEEERFDIKVEGLVVQKQLGQQTQVLAVYLGHIAWGMVSMVT